MIELETPRLYLRQWQSADYEPFAALNADPAVMAFFPAVLSRRESDVMADRIRSFISGNGWGCGRWRRRAWRRLSALPA